MDIYSKEVSPQRVRPSQLKNNLGNMVATSGATMNSALSIY